MEKPKSRELGYDDFLTLVRHLVQLEIRVREIFGLPVSRYLKQDASTDEAQATYLRMPKHISRAQIISSTKAHLCDSILSGVAAPKKIDWEEFNELVCETVDIVWEYLESDTPRDKDSILGAV